MDNNDIKLIQLGSYVRPDVREYYGRKWVLNGEKNSYPDYVIDRKIGSPTNGSILEVFGELLYGKGLAVKDSEEVYEELGEIFPKREQRKCLDDYLTFGYYFMQILRSKGTDKKVAKILHLPAEKMGRDKMDENGDINGAWYCDDWANTYKNKPKFIPEFKGKLDQPLMVKSVVPHQQGQTYFSLPGYVQALQYAEMEEEISNYCINHIKNGLSFGYIINFNNGGNLTPEQKNEVEAMIKAKLAGSSNAGKFILSFNDSKEAEVSVVPLEVSDAHSQWEFLNVLSATKIITAHGAFPNLFGINDGGGFANNADELDVQSRLVQDYQISPKQNFFIDELAELLELNGLDTDLVFIPLRETYKSTEATPEAEVVDEVVDENENEEEDVRMSEHVCLSDNNEATIELADHLISFGEELDEKEWYLLAENEVDYETDDLIYESIQFATSTGVARPNSKSSQDSDDIVIRYRYVGNKLPEREFCRKMMFANKLYRKEDIQQMDRSGINDGFGLGGTNSYSIWLWKGGGKMSTAFPNGTCKHKWNREIYLKRGGGVDVNSPLAKKISTTAARKKGYKVPTNDSDVSIAPHSNK
jgi:hypothetical protein